MKPKSLLLFSEYSRLIERIPQSIPAYLTEIKIRLWMCTDINNLRVWTFGILSLD